jgi:general secretion pathway protein D
LAIILLGAGLARGQVPAGGARTQVQAPDGLAREPQSAPATTFAEEVTLRELALACQHALDLPLEYDPETLKGFVRLRPGVAYTPREALELFERELAVRGMTTLQPPGAEVLRVVPLADAASLARLEGVSLEGARGGFVKVLVRLSHRSPEEILPVLQMLLSKPAGSITPAKEAGAILLADLRPNVAQILAFLDVLDRGAQEPQIVEFSLRHTNPITIAALVERVTSSRKAVLGRALAGALLPLAENRSVLVVAPEAEVVWWRETIERFDRPETVTTESYAPRRFGLAETAKLLEELVRGDGSGDGPRAWRLVQDELTGTLFVTTTPSRHAQIKNTLERLESVSPEGRRPMRVFSIRHRQVAELLAMLQDLLAAGVLETPAAAERVSSSPAPPQGPTAPLQQATSTRVVARASTPSGEVTLSADEGTNRLIAFGPAPLLDQLASLVATLDVRHAQVTVEALVLSLSESQTRDLAVEIQRLTSIGDAQIGLASLFGLGSPSPTASELPPASGSGFSGVVLEPGEFSALVRALEAQNRGRSLTIPKILVANNQQATLDSTLQTPYASTNASTTVATTSFGGTFDAGTSIAVKPQVSEGDQIVIEYTISISAFVGQPADPELPPPRQETKLRSVVTVPDGHTVVVGGLEIESQGKSANQVPILGSVPIVGALFRDESKSSSKSRFFVFLRCNVVKGRTFEDLRWASSQTLDQVGLDDGWPKLEPRVIR